MSKFDEFDTTDYTYKNIPFKNTFDADNPNEGAPKQRVTNQRPNRNSLSKVHPGHKLSAGEVPANQEEAEAAVMEMEAGTHELILSILTPKHIPKGKKYPVIVRFHGGFLMTGNRLHPAWFPEWVLDLALRTPAILITPEYRLAPESSGMDILSDMSSLISWLHEALPFLLSSMGLEADLDRVLLTGESAGGYLAVQAALLYACTPNKSLRISAVISAYGVLDIRSDWFTKDFEKNMMGFPQMPQDMLSNFIEDWKAGKGEAVVSGVWPPESREELTFSVVQHGQYLDVLGTDEELFPFDNLKKVPKGQVIPMWLFHGKDDSAVPVEGSEKFARAVEELHPDAQIKLTLVDGEHGLDLAPGVGVDTDWIAEGLKWTESQWLRD